MPYNKRKQKCTQSDGDKGSYVLSYTDKKGKKHKACHTSKKNMQGQIAAIEAESSDFDERWDGGENLVSSLDHAKIASGHKVHQGLEILKITESRLREIILEEVASQLSKSR